ncbi:hypothetical protein SLEP1_g60177 [Rubroshorea leprosula]|uniref:Uncharacterized protein n=1 Tax=Rubroshorea leprosula TaxID=152421 RepID=A0AAV5MVZ8_9ROSI|nr:hypothetical protein SLEP1_g60177 [Rubroshorea leprosula]
MDTSLGGVMVIRRHLYEVSSFLSLLASVKFCILDALALTWL